ncbi:MAG: MFS transporter [Marmoricola sp.]
MAGRSRMPRPWPMLIVSTIAQAASSAAQNGPAFLIPTLHHGGMTLAQAGLIAGAPIAGTMCTLVLWGAVVDRIGERFVMLASLLASTVGLAVSAALSDHRVALALALFLTGAASAGTAAASGRVVVGWFPPERRGMVMGIRQISQPVGVAFASLTVPVLAQGHGVRSALAVLGALGVVAVAACAVTIVDPPRPERSVGQVTPNPYRSDRYLARIHLASALLVIPQFTVWTYMLVWLQIGRHWAAGDAGALVAVAQVLGSVGRIGAGQLSDMVRSRIRPLRWIAVLAAAIMLGVGVSMGAHVWLAVPLIVVASVVTVADNGLAFTATAERAGPWWSGRALGVQNTGQFLTAAAVPPVVGSAITAIGYGATFGLTAAFPLLALVILPLADRVDVPLTHNRS